MLDLYWVRPDYETRGDDNPTTYPDAHRFVRMALSVGVILHISYEIVASAIDALERAANLYEDFDDRRYTVDEVAVMAEALAETRRELEAAVDDDHFPRGPGGEQLKREAAEPVTFESGHQDGERVFQLDPDGRISTLHPRMSLGTLMEALPGLVEFFQNAAARKLEVALIE
jgi:hypothetical protein